MRRSLSLSLLAAICFSVSFPSFAVAELVLHVYGSGSGIPGFYSESVTDSLGASINRSAQFTGNGTQTVSTFGQVSNNTSFENFVRLNASSASDKSGLDVPTADAVSVASWEDSVTLLNAQNLHANIGVRFHATGSLVGSLNQSGGDFWESSFFVADMLTTGESEDLIATRVAGGQVPSSVGLIRGAGREGAMVYGDYGWRTLAVTADGSFDGTFEMPVALNNSGTGYDFQFAFVAATDSAAGSADALIGNSISLTGVYDTLGNRLQSSFESGRLSAVPEPSSLYMFAISLVLIGRRRRFREHACIQ